MNRIAKAIAEASEALSRHVLSVKFGQTARKFSNRIAFAWKLASHGVPTTLIYLVLLGDEGSPNVLQDHNH